MLHIIGIILKIAGITLGGILAFLLLLLLIVLFCPIRYRCKIRILEEKEGCLVLSFFFHAFDYRIYYNPKKDVKKSFRILGIKVKKKNKKISNKKQKNKEKYDKESEKVKVQNAVQEKSETARVYKKIEETQKTDFVPVRTDKTIRERKSFFRKIKEHFVSIKNKICSIMIHGKKMVEKIKSIAEFLGNEQTKDAFRFLKEQAIKILKRIKPKKIKGNLHFGFSDPSSTGKLLGVLSWIYGPFSKSLILYPDFENKILEGTIDVKGSVQIYYLLIMGIRLYRSKEMDYLRNVLSENDMI